jgi:citrate lyase subunit beta/citryl-CoA lyase
MPGTNVRALEKGRELPADSLVFDLEDAVAPDSKLEARTRTVEALRAGGYGRREVLIRINSPGTPWSTDDIAAVASSGADGIVIPKVEDPASLTRIESALTAGGARTMPVWCMIETPLGVLRAEIIATSSRRLGGLIVGTSDLANNLHASHTRDRMPMLPSLGYCLLAARAAGVAILDGVHLDLDDVDGLSAACRQGAEMGFDGKTLIHPKQIAPANAAFSPSPEAVAWSRRIIEAHAEADRQGQGVVVIDGKLVENLHVSDAHQLLALDKAIQAIATD